jgi:hypothetical protein
LSFAPAPQAQQFEQLSNSESGAITLGLLISDIEAAGIQDIRLQMKQRLTADVPFTEYVFVQQIQDNVISGRDSNGKNLRFDQTAIDAGRVQVIVDGIIKNQDVDYVATPNIITFTTPLAIGVRTAVSVFGSAPTTLVDITLTKNAAATSTISGGAWGNIRWLQEYDKTTGIADRRWWLFTANTTGSISSEAQYQLDSIINVQTAAVIVPTVHSFQDVRFFLSSSPHDNTDRYLNLYVDAAPLADGFLMRSISTTFTELYAVADAIGDVSPPFQLIGGGSPAPDNSYIVVDTFPSNDRAASEALETKPKANKIIGPV